MTRLWVPSLFRGFELLAYLAPGLSGHVYQARGKDGSMVALKIFDKQHDPMIFAYFSNEQYLLREVKKHRQHPHVVEYIAEEMAQPPYYLATRFVEGGRELADLLGKPLAPAFVVRLTNQVASALDYLHAGHPQLSPIIHRDIKPNNILIDVAGNAVVIDLSIATYPGFAMDNERGLGTPQFMPPEQYTGDEVSATDQFALAAVALYALTGRSLLPKTPKQALKQLERLRDDDYKALHTLLGGRPHTAKVFVRGLAFEPAARYATCEQFAQSLHDALIADGVPFGADTPPKPHRSPRYMGWLLMALLGVAALLGLAIAALQRDVTAGSAAAVAAPTSTLAIAPAPPQLFVGATRPPLPPTTVIVTATPAPATATPRPTVPPPTRAPQIPAGGGRVVIIGTATEPLRATPSTDAAVLARMQPGEQATRTGKQQTVGRVLWYEVVFGSRTGWCRSSICTPR